VSSGNVNSLVVRNVNPSVTNSGCLQDNVWRKYVMDEKEFAPEELANSKRIFKSATPKGGFDWYIKWFATVMILSAVTIRSTGIPELQIYDMAFSWVGAIGWFVVSYIWQDRALILLNGVMGVLLFSGLIRYFVN
jgi:hypothetical protein